MFFVIMIVFLELKMKKINITNGQYFNEYISKKKEGLFIPFNEALIQGKPIYPLFDEDFILERTRTHCKDETKISDYINNMSDFLNATKDVNRYEEIRLWFGEDTFCVINLLGVLTYLEQIGYKNIVLLNVIDDESFNVLKTDIKIALGSFTSSYKSLFENNLFVKTSNEIIDKGINDYLYLQSKDNHLYLL